MINRKHQPQLDEFTPAEIRVLCEELLYTMEIEQRQKIMARHPGLYVRLYGRDTVESVVLQLREANK